MALRTALLSVALLAALAPADARVRLGGVRIGAGYLHGGYYSPYVPSGRRLKVTPELMKVRR